MPVPTPRSPWLHVLAVAALAVCLWIGWSDFALRIPQEHVRETIRAAPRGVVQLLVQFVVRAMLMGFLVREGIAVFSARRKAWTVVGPPLSPSARPARGRCG